MKLLPVALIELIDSLQNLPGVGPRSAERFAYYLLKSDPIKSKRMADNLSKLHESVKTCPKTFALIDKNEEVSTLYSDKSRDKQIVLVVEDPFDVLAIEKTGQYNGTYHVLGGLISPIDGVTPESIRVNELIDRSKSDKVKEIIIATNASVEGESTAYYIAKMFEGTKVAITRLAQGLPIGLDIEYADQITLGKALEGRRTV